jgi:hypothetical protein
MLKRLLFAAAIAAPCLPAQSGEWTDLLPDESLKGWTRVNIPSVTGLNPKPQWRVDAAQRLLICSGEGGHEWLRLDKEFDNFVLQVEWRFTPRAGENVRYNSGIGVRMTKFGDIWHQAQTGPTGGFLFGETLIDGVVRRVNLSKEMKENRIKPAGEWNQYEIRVDGDRISLSVNGAVVSELTGVGLRRGFLGLEAEGYEIAFRNIRLKALP